MKINNNNGLTLIECLISILLLAIMLAGGMSLYFNSSDIMGQAMHKKIANEMANQAMEEIKKTVEKPVDNNDPALDTGDKWIDIPTSSVGDFSAQVQKRIKNEETINPNTRKKIEIQVCWPDCVDARAKKIALVTYVIWKP